VINIDFEFCKRVGCPHYEPPGRALGFDMEASCNVVLEWNAQHVYTNKEGDTFEDMEKMLPWKDVPKDCPFVLEQIVGRQPKADS
jgi:hypothetical protein